MTDNLENTQQPTQENQEPVQITVNDVLEKKVDYFVLPKEQRDSLLEEYQKTLPKGSIAREFGYAPPEMFGGKDRHGNPVKPKTKEEFEQDFINKAKYGNNTELTKTKEELAAIKKQMDEMAALVKLQTNSHLQSEEEKINLRLQELTTNGLYEEKDFNLYNQLLKRKDELEQKKSQFTASEPKIEKVEPRQIIQYTPEEQEAISDFKYSNKDFVGAVSNNNQLLNSFDDFTKSIAKNRPELSPGEILVLAKESTERTFPNFFNNNKQNVFMNNQYATTSSNSFQKKTEATRIVFENLTPSDQKFIQGTARNYPGKSYQQVAELLFGKYVQQSKS
jgi:hypothetical protein